MLTTSLLLLTACAAHGSGMPGPLAGSRPRGIILFIGDGMGFSQVTLGRLAKGGPDARLALDDFPVTGFAKTHSADQWVTDSAAAATALAAGVKTKNFAIGMDAQGAAIRSIAEAARDKGYATGLVTTSRITHATPGPFAAHVAVRTSEAEIARQYVDAGIDVLMGGGEALFTSDLLGRYSEKGYHIVRTRGELVACGAKKLLGLFAEQHFDYVIDRPSTCPSLAEMTRRAIEVLSDRPFFLMVEGARIDMACHSADAPSSALEMIEFDEAVGVARQLAGPGTLIVVTADHATNGLDITEKTMSQWGNAARVKASADRIASLVDPRDAAGLRAALKEWAGIEDVTDVEAQLFLAATGPYDPAMRIGEIISRRCGITWMPSDHRMAAPNLTHGHDGAMVPVYACGPGAERFAGTLDNTDLPKRMRQQLGL